MEPRPGPTLVVSESEFLFAILMKAFDGPALVGGRIQRALLPLRRAGTGARATIKLLSNKRRRKLAG